MSPRPPKVIVIDFETAGIEKRPHYPPKPVGFSIKFPGDRKSKYYGWGHPTENTCTKEQAKEVLCKAWGSGLPLLCQNLKFDYDVAQVHMGMPDLDWSLLHDTLYLLFLDDPHASSHALKPSAERILGMKPEEQDAVRDWLVNHQGDLHATGLLPQNEHVTSKNFGKWISLAPGRLVGAYADGDVVRTELLFKKLWPEICDRGMCKAYDRERQLMPILLRNEREGIWFDVTLAERDVVLMQDGLVACDKWLHRILKSKDFNVDSGAELAAALIASGKADEALFTRTAKTGKVSTAKNSLIEAITDPRVLATLQYRSKLSTFIGTFLEPWVTEAQETGGLVHPSWNQVKQYGLGGDAGARTGRMSASRFMNCPKEVIKYTHPKWITAAPPLPLVRRYLLPDKGHLWGKRDYQQQEMRILAHYEQGVLLKQFQENPNLDMHVLVASLLNNKPASEVTEEERSVAKNNSFGLLYGMGIGKLAERIGVNVETATRLKREYLEILPGLKDLQKELTARGKSGQPIRLWDGREYYCEEPKEIDGHRRTFEYKLTNYLIQGSAAGCTKQAILNYDAVRKDGRFLLTVHDEINFSVPKKALVSEMKLLQDAMADVDFDVPMLSDGKFGPNWGNLEKFKEH
jgi:DNA polymerase I-like protein with 3'-5' exonuclease and polymerase domains